MVYERGEDDFVRAYRVSALAVTFVCEVTTVHDLFDHQLGNDLPFAAPGRYGAAPEHGRLFVIGVSGNGGQEYVAGDWNSPKGEIRWAVAAPKGVR